MFDRLVVALLRSVVRRSLGPLIEYVGRAQDAVNEALIPAASADTPASDHTGASVGTREDAGNGASRTILSWPSPSDGAA